jgi:hypothetical protein
MALVAWITDKRANDRWRDRPGDADLSEVVADEFRRLSRLIS